MNPLNLTIKQFELNIMAKMLAFFAHHEAYHIGQMGIIRKYFGEAAMEYGK
ncbi:hypothetical protein [Xanthovirga aplysinae]|uniref:hypothetical protein n=1 Tax=Xanthovirga aplysinae TaxID=2529853 RepID=UPI0012BB6A8D|nr:hypothetical protein [Xanthovirga aplysinae]